MYVSESEILKDFHLKNFHGSQTVVLPLVAWTQSHTGNGMTFRV